MSKMQKLGIFVIAIAVLALTGYFVEQNARHGAKKFALCGSGHCFYGDVVNTQNSGLCASISGGLVCGSYYLIVQH